MLEPVVSAGPPFCPNPRCNFHRHERARWRWVRDGYYARQCRPCRIRRYRCCHCRRRFSDQTFRTSYWLKRPELTAPLFWRLLSCSGFRQIARELGVSHTTLLTHAARLGRHCWLIHETLRPRRVAEPLVLDGFISFEWSQYYPTAFHLAVGQQSHFLYGFTLSELRRSGRMTPPQRRRRARLEVRHGRPHPRAVERDVAELLRIVTPGPQRLELHTDEHTDYPRALRRLGHLTVEHRTISSRAARTPRNPLFAVNLMDLLLRHSGAHHKRESIAFAKRRQSAAERVAVFLVWRNYVKSFSERARDGTPAMRLGLLDHRLSVEEILERRLFPSRVELPERWGSYYRREVTTRCIPRCVAHRLRYAT